MAKNENKIGGLWLSSSTNQKAPFAKGEIEVDGKKIKIIVWKNSYKQSGDKKPDYQIEIDRKEAGTVADPPKAEFTDDIPSPALVYSSNFGVKPWDLEELF